MRELRQFHDRDTYVLARKSDSVDDVLHTQLMTNGDTCSISNQSIQRRVKLMYVCNLESVQQPRILEVQEPKICEYEIKVGFGAFCADDSYSIETGKSDSLSEEDTQSEDWQLEISQVSTSSGDKIMCQVFTLEQRATGGSKLNFDNFELFIEPSSNQGQALTHDDYTARHPGRVAIPAKELIPETGKIKSSPQFDGQLAFVKLYA